MERPRAEQATSAATHAPPGPAPARRSWRRFFQFTIRRLLVLTTLIAIGLGWFVNRCARERRAVVAIEALNGRVEYRGPEHQPGAEAGWLRSKLPRSYFDPVTQVRFRASQVTDAGVAKLQSALPNCQIVGP